MFPKILGMKNANKVQIFFFFKIVRDEYRMTHFDIPVKCCRDTRWKR